MSELRRARKVVLATAVVVAALAAFVATSGGSQVSAYSSQGALTASSIANAASGGSYVSVASTVVTLNPGKHAAGQLACPASHPHAISGQFTSSKPRVFASASYQSVGGKDWFTQLTNIGSTAAKTQIGVICSS